MNSLPEQGRSQSDADFPIPETIDLGNRGPDKSPEDELMNDWQPSGHEKAIICTLALLNLVVALGAKVIVTSLTQAIIKDVSGTTTQAFWIGTSYLLVNAVSMPTISSISDVIGRPICLTVSIILFLIGTILCATSHSITVMLAGRSIQGVGGGGIHSISLITQPDFVPLRWRPKWYGMTLAAWAIGLSLGPIIGGVIPERTTWRWILYLMFPILGLGLVAVPYPLTLKPKKATAQEKFSRIDWVGMVIFTGSLTSFLIAISWGGTQHPWNSAATIAPLVIGALGIITTVFYEAYVAKFPFLRKELFRDFSSIATYIGGGLQGLILYGGLYYIPFYFQSVKEYTPTDPGVAWLPNALGFSVAAIVAGRIITRYSSFRWAIWTGWFTVSVGFAVYVVWTIHDTKPVWVISFLIAGVSHGIIITAQNFATQAMCSPGDEGAAAAMYIFVRQLGIALGVGIGATTLQNALKLKLRWDGLPTEIADQADTFIFTLHGLPDSPYKQAIYNAYRFGFQIIFGTWLGMSIFILFLCLVFIKHADMNRKLTSDHQLDGERIVRHWERKSP